jgi:molybdate transport system substrate-binding protein
VTAVGRAARPSVLALVLVALASVLGACGDAADDAAPDQPAGLTVAAASDLRLAFEELGQRFTAETGTTVTFAFGSSGQLREQIINGAPFDLFASANVAFVDAVIDAGRGLADTKTDYADGRLVLWAAPGFELPTSVEDLADPAYRRIAIANPEHAPYGTAAVEALESTGTYDAVADRLVYGENISDTLRIAESGNADVGIIALSLVITGDTDHTLVPAELHRPLRQALVVTTTGPRDDAARRFADFVNSPPGREVMVRYGFALPGEDLPV